MLCAAFPHCPDNGHRASAAVPYSTAATSATVAVNRCAETEKSLNGTWPSSADETRKKLQNWNPYSINLFPYCVISHHPSGLQCHRRICASRHVRDEIGVTRPTAVTDDDDHLPPIHACIVAPVSRLASPPLPSHVLVWLMHFVPQERTNERTLQRLLQEMLLDNHMSQVLL
ncbi:unnamed protein product [Soboliphyme baturini]|uniref:Uncharacterized protein n=1 Tax=Soboliphyme baturini TaxID=241478 RepID=A0A183IN66_9BILA|nr:unnamed protein product [Soboliphyme baturini]